MAVYAQCIFRVLKELISAYILTDLDNNVLVSDWLHFQG